MRKLVILLIFLIIAWVGISVGTELGGKSLPGVPEQQNSSVADQNSIGTPQSLSIPSINVSATIEQVGNDKEGKMDVPKDADNVAWYSLGYKPGQNGNAVFAGHFDKETGEPAVFSNLQNLKSGDTIQVKDSQGKEYTFSVVRTEKYPYNDFPIKEVFGESDKPMLNLITCEGAWDSASRNYSHRVVVFAELKG